MPTEYAQKLLQDAAAPTIERIRAERETAPERVRPVLAYLEEHLFDRNTNSEQVMYACGIRNHNFTTLFRRARKLTLMAYIKDARMETAGRLLRETDLTVQEIAELIGYTDLRTFAHNFRAVGPRSKWS
jgi:two-component system, response regulator YesN